MRADVPGPDVVCVGESMVVLTPEPLGALADAGTLRRGLGGAESNVAGYLAGLGVRVAWAGRVGADPFGAFVHGSIAAAGVDCRWLDEAHAVWGCETAGDVRALLPDPPALVVKDGAVGATAFDSGGRTFVPAHAVDVVEPVGAGDAFAAGYLFGTLRNVPQEARLRLGHTLAAVALRTTGDTGAAPPAEALLASAGITTPS